MAGSLPQALAAPTEDPFPNLSFREFSKFVDHNFSSRISLATVLTILFTLTNNPDLLNLHSCQQNPHNDGENAYVVTGWMKCLARALQERLSKDTSKLFNKSDKFESQTKEQIGHALSLKLDSFSKVLKLCSYDGQKRHVKNLQVISDHAIQPVITICPQAVECETYSCSGHSLVQSTRDCDLPHVTLIKGTKCYENVHVLSGKCSKCKTLYYADHESSVNVHTPTN